MLLAHLLCPRSIIALDTSHSKVVIVVMTVVMVVVMTAAVVMQKHLRSY